MPQVHVLSIAPDGNLANLTPVSAEELVIYMGSPEGELAMDAMLDALLTEGSTERQRFIDEVGHAPDVIAHVGEASAMPCSNRLQPVSFQDHTEVVVVALHTQNGMVAVKHPIRTIPKRHVALQPFPPEKDMRLVERRFTGEPGEQLSLARVTRH